MPRESSGFTQYTYKFLYDKNIKANLLKSAKEDFRKFSKIGNILYQIHYSKYKFSTPELCA